MPSYYTNVLTVFGAEPDVNEFFWTAKGGGCVLLLGACVPRITLGAVTDQVIADAQREQWGCRELEGWGIELKRSPRLLRYEFPSAWTPPIRWVGLVSRQFPRLRFELTYVDEIETTSGMLACVNGRTLESAHSDAAGVARRVAKRLMGSID